MNRFVEERNDRGESKGPPLTGKLIALRDA
jgi:hypothetical protein